MHRFPHFMKNTHIFPVMFVHETHREIQVEGGARILACAHCELLKWSHDNLASPFWRLYSNDRPGAFLILPNERVEIEPRRIVLIPPHTVFGTGCEGPVGHFYVHFALGLDRAATPGRIFQRRPASAELAMIRRLVTVSDIPPLEASFLVQALVNTSLAAIPDDYWDGRLTDERIARALETLGREGPAGDNAALAREAGMNPNAFIRKFLQATGHTPHQYRLRLRVERAAGWLREGRLDIEQIAAAAGFCDRFHFSRIFKKQIGVGPARYRTLFGTTG